MIIKQKSALYHKYVGYWIFASIPLYNCYIPIAQNLGLHSNTAVVAAASTWDHVICSNKKNMTTSRNRERGQIFYRAASILFTFTKWHTKPTVLRAPIHYGNITRSMWMIYCLRIANTPVIHSSRYVLFCFFTVF